MAGHQTPVSDIMSFHSGCTDPNPVCFSVSCNSDPHPYLYVCQTLPEHCQWQDIRHQYQTSCCTSVIILTLTQSVAVCLATMTVAHTCMSVRHSVNIISSKFFIHLTWGNYMARHQTLASDIMSYRSGLGPLWASHTFKFPG